LLEPITTSRLNPPFSFSPFLNIALTDLLCVLFVLKTFLLIVSNYSVFKPQQCQLISVYTVYLYSVVSLVAMKDKLMWLIAKKESTSENQRDNGQTCVGNRDNPVDRSDNGHQSAEHPRGY